MMNKAVRMFGCAALVASLVNVPVSASQQTGMSGMGGMGGMSGMSGMGGMSGMSGMGGMSGMSGMGGMSGMSGMGGMSGMSGNQGPKHQIDSWSKAHTIASAWLKLSNLSGQSVGRIRKINRIYVISIVDEQPPHNLQNQLIIRATDGYTTPVF
ncbi:MAG: hypothetical protein ABW086_16095 [Sedimenticola sp.]